jgi:heme/copper-type cytochrome/quinol oxidase subunit 2
MIKKITQKAAWEVNMIFKLIVSIVIVILGLTIFFVARKYEKHQPDLNKPAYNINYCMQAYIMQL